MLSYSGISIGIEKQKKISISQANPLQLSDILMKLRYKAYSESNNTIYNYQMDYQYQYKYYQAKLSRYDDLEHKVVIQLSSLMPEARYRIDTGAGFILKNYSDENIYYSQYPIPRNIFINEIPIFKNYTLFLSLRRSLIELRKKIWRLYSIIETKKKVSKLWEYEYQEALQERTENEYVYTLTTNNLDMDIRECAERLKQIRFNETRRVKELIVLNQLEDVNINGGELEREYSDESTRKDRECCPDLPNKRIGLHRSRSEGLLAPLSVKKEMGNREVDNIESVFPDSTEIRKELNRLPPRPEG